MRQLKSVRNTKTVQVLPIVVGLLGSVTKNLDKWLGKLDVKIGISLLQKTTYVTKNSKDSEKSIRAVE